MIKNMIKTKLVVYLTTIPLIYLSIVGCDGNTHLYQRHHAEQGYHASIIGDKTALYISAPDINGYLDISRLRVTIKSNRQQINPGKFYSDNVVVVFYGADGEIIRPKSTVLPDNSELKCEVEQDERHLSYLLNYRMGVVTEYTQRVHKRDGTEEWRTKTHSQLIPEDIDITKLSIRLNSRHSEDGDFDSETIDQNKPMQCALVAKNDWQPIAPIR